MKTILLTGSPGVGKTDLVRRTQELSRRYQERDVLSISMSGLVAEAAWDRFHTPAGRICYIDPEAQATLRYGAISEAARRLLLHSTQDTVIDTPMTMYVAGGSVLNHIFGSRDIEILDGSRPLDYLVTVLEDPHVIAQRLAGLPYPSDIPNILNWMASEVDSTLDAGHQINVRRREKGLSLSQHLVIPRNHSDETLTKLLSDAQPQVCYLVRPITHLRPSPQDHPEIAEQKKQARKRVRAFQDRLQEYAVVIAPMELADLGVTEPEKAHTVFRDKQWFVANAHLVIAYFPGEYVSEGAKEEIRAHLRMGKPVAMIHPRADTEVFGIRPTLCFPDEEEFFSAVQESKRNPRYALLQDLLDPHQEVPRYAHLRNYAVALDFRKDDRHLLQRQGPRKEYAGQWMLVAGKKEPGQNDFRALYEEAWQEAGIRLLGVEPGYRMYPVDYAQETPEGVTAKYVRIYVAQDGQWQGQPVANNHTDSQEVAEVGFLTREEILRLGDQGKVVPATLQYFRELLSERK